MKNSFRLMEINGYPVYIKYWFFILLLFGVNIFISLFIAIIVHEIAHAFIAQKLGYKVRKIFLDILYGGADISFVHEDNRVDSILICVAGPISNLLLYILGYLSLLLTNIDSGLVIEFLDTFCYVNIILFIFNMLPIFPMDGGRISKAVLSIIFNNSKGKLYNGILSTLFSLVLLSISIYLFNIVLIFMSIFFIYIGYTEIRYNKYD